MDEERQANLKMIKQINIDELNKVKDYLTEHPLSGIMEVCRATGVSSATLHKFVTYKLLKLRLDIPASKDKGK